MTNKGTSGLVLFQPNGTTKQATFAHTYEDVRANSDLKRPWMSE